MMEVYLLIILAGLVFAAGCFVAEWISRSSLKRTQGRVRRDEFAEEKPKRRLEDLVVPYLAVAVLLAIILAAFLFFRR
jgi:hypothetical protein